MNYSNNARQAMEAFCGTDADSISERLSLPVNEGRIRVRFLDKEMDADTSSGMVTAADIGTEADEDTLLAVLDYLVTASAEVKPKAVWVSPAQLRGPGGRYDVSGYLKDLKDFDDDAIAMCGACENLGGRARKGADCSYVFEVLPGLPMWFQYWAGDDEFPASVQFLFDETATEKCHFAALENIMQAFVTRLSSFVTA